MSPVAGGKRTKIYGRTPKNTYTVNNSIWRDSNPYPVWRQTYTPSGRKIYEYSLVYHDNKSLHNVFALPSNNLHTE